MTKEQILDMATAVFDSQGHSLEVTLSLRKMLGRVYDAGHADGILEARRTAVMTQVATQLIDEAGEDDAQIKNLTNKEKQ